MKQIKLPHHLDYRWYQRPLVEFIRNGGKRGVVCWHRRAGKDKTFFNLLVEMAIREVGGYAYILPTYSQGKKIVWDSIDTKGLRFKDHIPEEILVSENGTELKFTLANGSFIQILGSDTIDNIRGISPKGLVFSEFAFQNPTAWEVMRPILAENKGWAIFNSTPNGKNHFYDMYEMAKENESWFCQRLTVDDTQAVDEEYIKQERLDGMSEEMIQQEYYCSFDVGAIGSYYADLIEEARQEGRITQIPITRTTQTDIYLDLGRNDQTSIWFKQNDGMFYNFINCYEDNGKYIDEYFNYIDNYIKEKHLELGYIYLPHDSKQKRIDTTKSTYELACERYGEHNIIFIPQTKSTIEDINTTRKVIPKCRFDKDSCRQGIRCLENYKKDYDDKKKVFKNEPRHDWASHGSDAFRYFAVSIGEQEEQTDYRISTIGSV